MSMVVIRPPTAPWYSVVDSDALRTFVIEHLSTRQEVAHTQTSLVFEHVRGSRTVSS